MRTRWPSGEKATALTGSVSHERRDRGPGRRVPQPRRLVQGAGENALAVGREGDRPDTVCVSHERRDRGPGRRVPQPRRLVQGAGENALAVGREGDRQDGACVSRKNSCAQPNERTICAMLYRERASPSPPMASDGRECRGFSDRVAHQGRSAWRRRRRRRQPSCRPSPRRTVSGRSSVSASS